MKRRAFIRLLNEKLWFETLPGLDLSKLDEWPEKLQVEWLIKPTLGEETPHNFLPLDKLRGALEAVDPGLLDLEVVLILGGENCFTTQVNIPSKQSKHIAQALPFMLEDQLAEDVETFLFASGPRSKDGNVSVLACSKLLISLVSQAFREQSVALDAIVPDMLCAPIAEGQWTFICDAKTLGVRMGPLLGLTIEMDALPVVSLALLRGGVVAPTQIQVIFAHRHLSDNIQAWLRTQFTSMVAGTDIQIEFQNMEDERFSVLTDFLTAGSALPLNLLQGDLKPLPKRKASNFKWKPTAALAGVLALMQTTYLYAQSWQMRSQVATIDQEVISTYRKYFPQDRVIRDARRQMEAHLTQAEKLSSGASFMVLLAQVGQQLNDMNRGKPTPQITPARMSYDEAQGDIKVDLVAESYAVLDSLKDHIKSIPLAVEVSSASQEGERVKARVRVWSEMK